MAFVTELMPIGVWSGANRWAGMSVSRDGLRDHPESFAHLDAAQLFKHAFALRSEVHRRERRRPLRPILFYLYAEAGISGRRTAKAVDERATSPAPE